MKATAVIGANYGDEGKGLMVDALSDSDTLVVRFNGGPQAGHTVVTPDGRRHAFSSVGSGAFVGAKTLFARETLVNPLFLFYELEKLKDLGVHARVFFDPRCTVITPVDIAINQYVEQCRGVNKHGSCGHGINETVERSLLPEFRLTVEDLKLGWLDVINKMVAIRKDYAPARIERLGFDPAGFKIEDRLSIEWMNSIEWFRKAALCQYDYHGIINAKRVVFEGAQGLGLDQTIGTFPHVTRSNTGVKNIMPLIQESGLGEVEVVYVTRTYLTRHGAGPLEGESTPEEMGLKVDDPTNVYNKWQDSIRYAPLDVDGLVTRVLRDKATSEKTRVGFAVTCVDQMDKWFSQDTLHQLLDRLGDAWWFNSYGPTRHAVVSRGCLVTGSLHFVVT